eukprot:m.108430 g.108430  ORF g.108430 m.108430 type:complete len:491 (-) comp15866_c0_seq7:112-1584(-)
MMDDELERARRDRRARDQGEGDGDVVESVVLAVFTALDTNGDGRLDEAELATALSRLGLQCASAHLEGLMQAMKHAEGREECFNAFRDFYTVRTGQLREVFNSMDRDGDGELQKWEVRQALHDLGMSCSDQTLRALFNKIDLDKNGRISFEEFRAFLLLVPANDPRALLDVWSRVAVEDAQSEFTVVRDIHEQGESMRSVYGKLAAGACSGAISRTATAPLDRVRLVIQARNKALALPLSRELRRIYVDGGLRSFFRGNGVNVLKVIPESGAKFAVYDLLKPLIAKDPDNVTTAERFIAGGTAGAISQALIYPMEIARTRMALAPPGLYTSIADCWRKVVLTSGWSGLFSGLGTSIFGIVPYAGVDLACNAAIKDFLTEEFEKRKVKPGVGTLLAAGIASSTVALLATFPVGVVRTRLQASNMPGMPQYDGAWHCVTETYRTQGLRGFYRGLIPTLLKVLPAAAIGWVTYDSMAAFFAEHHSRPHMASTR